MPASNGLLVYKDAVPLANQEKQKKLNLITHQTQRKEGREAAAAAIPSAPSLRRKPLSVQKLSVNINCKTTGTIASPKKPLSRCGTKPPSPARKTTPVSSPAPTVSSPVPAVSPSLCSDCRRAISSSSSNGAVCFIGNNGRVSACSVRSAITLCKNLQCAANNPSYVAAMSTAAPKKYLISKRHQLPSYGLINTKLKLSPSPSPSPSPPPSLLHQGHKQDLEARKKSPNGFQPHQNKNVVAGRSPFNASSSSSSSDPNKNIAMSMSVNSCSLSSNDSSSNEEDSLSCDMGFLHMYTDGDSSIYSMGSTEEMGDVASRFYAAAALPGSNSFNQLREECLKDDDRFLVESLSDGASRGFPRHTGENKVSFGETEDVNKELMVHDDDISSLVGDGDNDGLSHSLHHDESLDSEDPSDGFVHSNGDIVPPFNACIVATAVGFNRESMGEDFTMDNVNIEASLNDANRDIAEVVTLAHGDMVQYLVKSNDDVDGDVKSHLFEDVTMFSGSIMSSNVDMNDKNEDVSGEESTMDSSRDIMSSHIEEYNVSEDINPGNAQSLGDEHSHEEENTDCVDSNGYANEKRFQRRRTRVLEVVEDLNPESVTLRKQKALERKGAEEWMINHAIEGVVCKLAPTGKPKVKILVEAFESVISYKDPLESMN